ncbi:uncharacterized protein LOC113231622 isoform X5 [Hyposmocoma kahamanoa]|uniref:uncharacterized protein LOC113231622 isoform X5 n=1 Tax=Hyposmocoma kahamanoa TaxID=1477025 RepID=UPI000E6D8DEE|nr:uncharacterized protein LOC113231622 isoform X5 [Hyposmocoma kahamanoa]
MLKVKLVVLFVLILVPILTDASYCEICVNHTLCQYPISGPSKTCIEYDVAALLTRGDISDIVHRINDRRNFIALGLSNRLPQAANMRKINWSKELATIAQRWVDQCDPSINPDKWDSCRDLADVAVGQNVATIIGPAPGLSVKSFIDMWLMQKLDYTGSVSYYNQSRDAKSGYLTQLIWAATDSVGCGRAKFYIEDKNIVVERLICNFAPRGNLQGKPVYAVGFAATQCPESLFPDYTMKGLCTVRKQTTGNFKHRSSTATSFLRVINLSNESVKQEIDPLKNNMKQVKLHGPSDQRNQKIRHVLMNNVNNSHGKSDKPLFPPRRIPWNIQTSSPGNTPVEQYETEKGHSKVYHGYDKDNFIPRITQSSNQEFRSDRVRREPEDHVTFKPFWQLDEYSNLKPSQLKSLHYTTLKKNRKKWPVSVTTQTESITIKLENSEIEVDDDEENEVTEKYLSFDELMHLRKINAGGYDARRDKKKPDKKKSQKKKPDKQKLKDKNAKTTKKTKTTKKAKPTKKAKTTKKDKTTKKAKTTKIAKTTKKAKVTTAKVKTTTPQTDKLKVDEDKDKKKETENKNDKKETTKATKLQPTAASLPLNYTTNTPFQRKKHCTRQLTCTWTVATVTASDGSVVIGGGGAVHGSRTPPGYVEGCTRTSTCTRDFQNRNKYMTPENEETNRGDGGGNDDGDDSNDEGDYCDRRALDVKLRNFEGEPEHNHGSPETHTVPATTPPYHNPGTTPMCKTDKLGSGPTDHCDCNEENIRPKRHLSSDQININSHGCHANCDIRNTNQQDQLLSYGELYYLVLSKIMKTWGEIENSKHSENCECSGSTTLSVCYLGLALIIIFNAMQ